MEMMVKRLEESLVSIEHQLCLIREEETREIDAKLNTLETEVAKLHANEFNVMNVFGIETKESSHSSFLAWLLNPLGTHRLLDSFLKQFIETVARKKNREDDLKKIDFENAKIKREEEGAESIADIRIFNQTFSCVVENKIESPEAPDQTPRLRRDFSNKAPVEFFVYLTPFKNDEPKCDSFKPPLSYYEIRDMFKKINANGHTKYIIDEYIKNLEVRILTKEEFDKRTELYFKHYKNIEEIENSWNKDRKNFYSALKDKLTQQRWYNPKEWSARVEGSFVAISKKGWQDGKVILYFQIQPGEDEALEWGVYAYNFPDREAFNKEFWKRVEKLRDKTKDFKMVRSDATLIERRSLFDFRWTNTLNTAVSTINEMIEIFADEIDAAMSKVSSK